MRDCVSHIVRKAMLVNSHKYSFLNKTRIIITPADMLVKLGKYHKAPSLDEELQAVNGCCEGESVFRRDESLSWLSSIKWSALK